MFGRNDVLTKTQVGRDWIQSRDRRYPPAWRAFAITVDGRKGLSDLTQVMSALQLALPDVKAMVEAGLLSVVADGPQLAAAPELKGLAKPSGKSLASAKMYALDLIARMFGKDDAPLREAARSAIDHTSLMAWLQICEEHIAAELGRVRADAFAAEVTKVLPD